MMNILPRWDRIGLAAAILAGLASLVVVPRTSSAGDSRKIEWRDDLGSAQVESKSRDLLLWIQFTGPWCINCVRMERSTFAHAGVVSRSRDQFVPVKLRSDEHEALALTLGLTGLPATVLVRPNGEVAAKYQGYIEPETFEATLLDVLRREERAPEQVAEKARRRAESLALAGHCPVTLLRDNKLVPGRADLAVEHDGRTFRFAGEAERVAFRRAPDAYAPANDGRCPVSQVDRGDFLPGDPRWGVVYKGHVYLFKDAPGRERFAKDPERYANIDLADRGASCRHCRELSRVAGGPPRRFSSSTPVGPRATPAPDRIEALLVPTATVFR